MIVRLGAAPVEFKFFTNWSWILQALVFTLATLPFHRTRRVAGALLPSCYLLVVLVFVGVTAIAYLNPWVLLKPTAGEGILVDHVMHALTLTLTVAFAPSVVAAADTSAERLSHRWWWRCGPALALLLIYRSLYEPNAIYLHGVKPVAERWWWVGALVSLACGDRLCCETVLNARPSLMNDNSTWDKKKALPGEETELDDASADAKVIVRTV